MFTGIIEEQGTIEKVEKKKNLWRLTLKAKKVLKQTKIGESLCVDGVCLTAVFKTKKTLSFEVMKETLRSTTLQFVNPKQKVNLERALRMGDRLGGHFLTGHIDGMGFIKKMIKKKNEVEYQIHAPRSLMRYIVLKGSIAIDGISLTVGRVRKNVFSVYLIPYTLKVTTLGSKSVADFVNIETDILAKYVLG